MSFQENLTCLAAAIGIPISYSAKEFGLISYSFYNSAMLLTVIVATILLWRITKCKKH